MATTMKAISLENMDKSVSPADNFYRFANGKWLDTHEIPSEYSRWGTFEELNELSLEQLHCILDDCVKGGYNNTEHANELAIAILYSTGMDEETCEKNGLQPIQDIIDEIDNNIKTPQDIIKFQAKCSSKFGVHGGLFSLSSIPDAKNSSWEVVSLSQSSSLGIGDRDFYFREDKQSIRDEYVKHVSNILKISQFKVNDDDYSKCAQLMFDLELKLAKSHLTKTEHRDPLKVFNKFTSLSELIEKTSSNNNIPWNDYFKLIGLEEEQLKSIIVDNPSYFETLSTQLEETSIETWKTYLIFHVTRSMSDYLNNELKSESFKFYGVTMTGQPKMKSRWKRVLQSGITDSLEDSLGLLYTNKHFNAKAKNACLEMVNVLIEVFRKRIDELDWMKDETKKKALVKLENFRPMIGYPDKWDIDDIPELLNHISYQNSYGYNIRQCKIRNFQKVIQRIDKPVDNNRWEMPATIINAYFHPYKNVIVFPAAILQPPFFFHPTEDEPHGDVAVNFSAIGAVICHEISHGYDDQGRKFDAKGELVDWWTEDDAKEYEKRASNMEKLCSDYEFFGKSLNGKLCLGENIADYGGVALSYRGLQSYQQKHGKLQSVDGFTPEQRFFLGWASVWRNNIREENALQRIIMDPHAPGEFRANIVKVVDEFHKAFNVQESDGMYVAPEKRCEIW